MPKNRSGRIAFLLLIIVTLAVIGRNLYRRYLTNALIAAVKAEDVEAVRMLLNRGADPASLSTNSFAIPGPNGDMSRTQSILGLALAKLLVADTTANSASAETQGEHHQPTYTLDERAEAITCLLIRKSTPMRNTRDLNWACSVGDVPVVRALLERGVDFISAADMASTLNSALYYATSFPVNSHPMVSPQGILLLRTTPADRAEAARRLAVGRQLVQMLREHGANPTLLQVQQLGDRQAETQILNGSRDAWADQGYEALIMAARADDLELMRQLLDHGADPNHPPAPKPLPNGVMFGSQYYDPPLSVAASRGNLEAVKLLLAHRADPNTRQGITGVLAAAARTGNLALVTLLLAHGAEPNRIGKNGETALSAAAGAGKLDMVKLLLARGAKLNVDSPFSPLQAAARSGHADIVHTLLEHGADPNSGRFPFTPLTIALRSAPRTVPELLKHGARVNLPQSPQNTFLYFASPLSPLANALWYAPQYEKLLVQAGAKIGPDRPTICVFAAQHGRFDLLPKLIAYGADVNGVGVNMLSGNGAMGMYRPALNGVDHDTALTVCIDRAPASVKLLLDHSANPNVVIASHLAPLEMAARMGNTEIVRLLLAHGADINAHPDRHTALDWAQKKNHADIVDLLRRAGAKE